MNGIFDVKEFRDSQHKQDGNNLLYQTSSILLLIPACNHSIANNAETLVQLQIEIKANKDSK